MAGTLGKVGMAVLMGFLVLGCRTPRPNLKPANQPEVLMAPPEGSRYSDPNNVLPKQAYNNKNDPYLRDLNAVNQASGMSTSMPGRGSMGGSVPGGR